MIPKDKLYHLAAGAAVAFVVYLASGNAINAVAASFIVGALKEAYDHLQNKRAEKKGLPLPHSVEALDILYTGVGGALVAIAITAKSFI